MSSPLAAIFLIVVVDVLAFTLIIPLLPFYAERFGATPWQVGLLVAAFAACQLVAGPVLGRLSDRVGRKPVLVLSQLGTFVGFVVLGLANSLWMVFLSRVIDGVTAGNLAVAQAAIADVTTPEKRARGFALIGVAFGLGFLVGPALSGWLATVDVRLPIALAAGLSLLSVVLTSILLPSRQSGPPAPASERRLGVFEWGQYAAYLRRAGLASRFLQYFCFSLSFVTFTTGFALFAERRLTHDGHPWGPREVGLLLTWLGFLGVVLQGAVVSRAIERWGAHRVVLFGFLFQGLGFSLLAYTFEVRMLVVAATLSALGSSPLRPGLSSLISRQVEAHEQGAVLGLTQSLNSIAQCGAPLLAGALLGRSWLGAWALTAGGFALAGLLVPTRPPEGLEHAKI